MIIDGVVKMTKKIANATITKCDIDKSLYAFVNNPSGLFQEGDCYRNAFNLMATCRGKWESISGVIGYVLSENDERKVAIRHSWIRDERTGLAIDVSVFAADYHPIEVVDFDYAEVRVIPTADWIEQIIENDFMPCLPQTPDEIKFLTEIKKQGYEVLGEIK